MENIFAVILAGGAGVRFWPYSREYWPKQMLDIVGEDSLLRQTIRRLENFIPPENIYIVTTAKLAQDIQHHLIRLGRDARKITLIQEPMGKNTAAAIGLAAIHIKKIHGDGVMLTMPSDHLIRNIDSFQEAMKTAVKGAEKGFMITFGIKPNKPETGYGYIEVKGGYGDFGPPFMKLERFVEKPDLEAAKTYVEKGNYFWNSGIFLWKISKILEEIERHMPQLSTGLKVIEESLGSTTEKETVETVYSGFQSQSVDYGILEKSQDVLTILGSFDWTDLGSWGSLYDVLEANPKGNIVKGDVIEVDNENSLLLGSHRILAAIGLKEMVVVDTPDATLVCPKGRVQEVRKVVDELKKNVREEHLIHRTVERPWGSYTVLEKGDRYQIKRVVVNSKEKLSLQVHRHRSEHWVVISGTAKVTKDSEVFYVHPGESTYIPVSTKHRLENPGQILLQIIEVQNGDYVGEDDIERFDDDYGRS